MRALAAILILAALAATGCGGHSAAPHRRAGAAAKTPAELPPGEPSPHAAIPRSPARLAQRLASVDSMLRRHLAAWLSGSPARRALPPRPVVLEALYEQRNYRFLARHPDLIGPAIAAMPRRLRPQTRDSVGALHALFTITSRATEVRFRTGSPQPPGVLRGLYSAAQRRYGVRWSVLAGVNMIESNFGRLRNTSNAGAVGPMQFLPATWRAYGRGGNIRDPHDAILGAANYLHSSGAPGSYSRALIHYNQSPLYVRAVLRFAHRMASDRLAFYEYWSWQSFRRSGRRDVQLTGPGS